MIYRGGNYPAALGARDDSLGPRSRIGRQLLAVGVRRRGGVFIAGRHTLSVRPLFTHRGLPYTASVIDAGLRTSSANVAELPEPPPFGQSGRTDDRRC